jgi:hypothetical protein
MRGGLWNLVLGDLFVAGWNYRASAKAAALCSAVGGGLPPRMVVFGHTRRQPSIFTPRNSSFSKVNVTNGPSRTFKTRGGRKQAMQIPPLRRTLG